MKNRIINGDMRIDQRNEGATLSVGAASVFRSVDKFTGFGSAAAGVFTLQRLSATPPTGFTHYLRATVTTADAAPAAGSLYLLFTTIEGFLIQDTAFGLAAAANVSVSFWIRSSLTGNFSVALKNGAVNRSYVTSFNIPTINTWTKISISVPGDITGTWALGTNAAGIIVELDLGSGATATTATTSAWQAANVSRASGSATLMGTNGSTLDLTAAQFEVSSNATNFDYLLMPVQLECCERYFAKSFAQGTAPVQNAGINTGETQFNATIAAAAGDHGYITYPVTMRATPSAVTFFNPAAANVQARDITGGADCSATAVANSTDRGSRIDTTGAAGSLVGNVLAAHWTAEADY